jgi:hemerythrin
VKDIVWDDTLSVAVYEIDEDHRKLVKILNTLNHSVAEGGSPDCQAAILDELIKYTVLHFSNEEHLMQMYGYEEIEDHKAEHRKLIKLFNRTMKLQQEILQENIPVLDEDIEFLERWLTEHILTADMKLGSYLSKVM